MKTKYWHLNTKLLHLGLVATVSLQLLISLFMVTPDHKGGTIGKAAFELHEIVGMTALVIVLAHWIWSVRNQVDGGLKHLFPWRGEARKNVVDDINHLLKGRLSQEGNRAGLPGLIHGLGFLAVTGMVLTGAILFILFPESGEPGFVTEIFAELHEGIAGFVWVYWIGHAGIALLHHYSGHDTLRNMFNFSKKKVTLSTAGIRKSSTDQFER